MEIPTVLIADREMLSTSSIKESNKQRFEKEFQKNIQMPTPLFITSITASVAFCTLENLYHRNHDGAN